MNQQGMSGVATGLSSNQGMGQQMAPMGGYNQHTQGGTAQGPQTMSYAGNMSTQQQYQMRQRQQMLAMQQQQQQPQMMAQLQRQLSGGAGQQQPPPQYGNYPQQY